MTTVTVDIPRDPTAPGQARRALDALAGRVSADVVPDAKLLATELVTNAVKYGAGGPVHLEIVSEDPCRLRVAVVDEGSGFTPVARSRPTTEVGGWGLHLVERLSDRWGVADGATRVWFEVSAAG